MASAYVETPVAIAYIISAYKLPHQLARLVHRLDTERSCFFLHVDRKANKGAFQLVRDDLRHLRHVFFLKQHTCYWGGFGHVAATLEGIRTLVRTAIPFDYVVLLTGQDYPIKSTDYVENFLAEHRGSSFIQYFPLPYGEWNNGGLDRVESWHVRILDRHFRFPPAGSHWRRRAPVGNMPFFGGSSYWCISRECVEYIIAFLARNGDFERFFKYVDVPDELFFQTLLLNSPYGDALVNDDLRYVRWGDPDAGSPSVLTAMDFTDLARSPKLFARKFDTSVDSTVLDMIDAHVNA